MISLLIVTRERADDRRFGLGKSLDPVIEVLRDEGVEILYLCQEDAGVRGRRILARLQDLLVRGFGWAMADVDFDALVGGLLERLNMGRLAAKVAFDNGITHVHCHDPVIAAGFQWFRWWCGGRAAGKVRHGLTQHGFGSYTQALHEDGARLDARVMGWLRRWERRIMQRCDWVVLPTVASRDQLARDLACYPMPDHWHVIPHPRPVLELSSRQQARQLLGWRDDWFVVLGVGRNAPLKRFGDLIHAAAMLDHDHLHLVLLGPGEDPALRRLAQAAGLPADRLHLAAGPDAGVYYSGADMYASTSTTESFGLANLEALEAALPVVATAVGGVPEVVGNGGWLLPPCHPTVLAEVIESLLLDRDLCQEISRRARAWVGRWPDAQRIAAQYLALYQDGKIEDALHRKMPRGRRQEGAVEMDLSVYPLPRPLPLSGDLRVLVFAPHPDDETLGVGGILAGLTDVGAGVRLVVVTEGEGGDPGHKFPQPAFQVRQKELRQALSILGVEDHAQWHLPDGGCRDDASLRERVREEILDYAPDWLLVPAPLEIHRDHVAVANAVTRAWHQAGAPGRLFYYEVSQPLPATHVVDVAKWRQTKLLALQCYKMPLSYCDYAGMSASLMRYRAECLAPGIEAVEALLELRPRNDLSLLRAMATLRRQMDTESPL